MITLYGWAGSPNVLKVRVMLEEAEIPYEERRVKREEDENRTPEFLQISATGLLPAITDSETGASVFESSAILLYLADRTGKFLPAEPALRADVFKWHVFEAANISPAIANIYKLYYLDDDWAGSAIEFHQQKLIGAIELLNQQLEKSDYIAGDCSIADFAMFPLSNILEDFLERPLADFPNLEQWCNRMRNRPGVKRAANYVNAA